MGKNAYNKALRRAVIPLRSIAAGERDIISVKNKFFPLPVWLGSICDSHEVR